MRYDNFMMSANLNVVHFAEDWCQKNMHVSKTTVTKSVTIFALYVCPAYACGRHAVKDLF